MRRSWLALTSVVALTTGLSACADDRVEAPSDLSADARAGFDVAAANGCFACHGDGGTGGVAPALVGLAGTTVALADGTSVTADEPYLRTSITDPKAQLLPGFSIAMPVPVLSDEQVDALVTWMLETGRD